jgi:hypothetical protein
MGTLIAAILMAGTVSSTVTHPLQVRFDGIDPYGSNLFQAQEHNYCVSSCAGSYQTCLMSYVPDPSPRAYCEHIQEVCTRRCP